MTPLTRYVVAVCSEGDRLRWFVLDLSRGRVCDTYYDYQPARDEARQLNQRQEREQGGG